MPADRLMSLLVFGARKNPGSVMPNTSRVYVTYRNTITVTFYWARWHLKSPANHLYCSLNRLFRCGRQKTSKLRVIGLWEGNSPTTGECPTQRFSNAKYVSIWLRHHVFRIDMWRDTLHDSPIRNRTLAPSEYPIRHRVIITQEVSSHRDW